MIKRFALKNIKATTQVNQIVARNYAAAAATATKGEAKNNVNVKVKLEEEIESLLNENVLKSIYAKNDALLIKKLNYLGSEIAVRLNVASKEHIDFINGKTVFRIMTQELPEPWTYYWTVILENGNCPEKWLQSLKDTKDNAAVNHKCWYQMMINGVESEPRHYAAFFDSLATIGDHPTTAIWLDHLIRFNYFQAEKDFSPIAGPLVKTWFLSENPDMVNLCIEFCKQKGWKIPEDVQKRAEEIMNADQTNIMDYWFNGTANEDVQFAARNQKQKDTFNNMMYQRSTILQPPKEALYCVDDNPTRHKKELAERKF
mmetsp:Transcript_4883/g.7230  ORF Transcript_4883/g.7230 Transcript_4883/m.7230 type:complete len:315 (+) Transcript_4883:34-978(+)|eukprot:CAMPEP_0117423126 /NCGR_PEP_ID=MMETSP0758-20121206/3822_1 /TAXON_ID=63605 /ORGANISM="Percolomonas cosmopolitus, Strain AE-1 (ATCC 50343)" /LENGTH=314 /DNA_ID=CAMNT_0005206147 /DNA_START=30 /DNA_END=974 /DNA_ORIENTATION=-